MNTLGYDSNSNVDLYQYSCKVVSASGGRRRKRGQEWWLGHCDRVHKYINAFLEISSSSINVDTLPNSGGIVKGNETCGALEFQRCKKYLKNFK